MKRIILTDRDNEIIQFLQDYKCATTSTLSTVFFKGSLRPCSRRLKHLREHGFINSSQEYVSMEQIHYIGKKPTQLQHSCILSKFISKLYENNIDIVKSKVEFKVDTVRADLMIVISRNGKKYIYLVEVCNTKKFDIKKYVKLKHSGSYRETLPVFPCVVVISDKPVETHPDIKIKQYNLKFDDFKF